MLHDHPELDFAHIDAKERAVVSIRGIRNAYGNPQTEENIRILAQAEKEYLMRLDSLQKELKAKYSTLLHPEDIGDANISYEIESRIRNDVWAETKENDYSHLYYT